MSSTENVKGEGFEILGHEAPKVTDEEQGGPEAPKEEQAARALDVYTVLRVSASQLAGVAWQMMGLQADPFTGKTGKDIEQARIAIDATAALIERLLPHLQGQDAKDYQSLLTDLRLNFVKQAEGKGH